MHLFSLGFLAGAIATLLILSFIKLNDIERIDDDGIHKEQSDCDSCRYSSNCSYFREHSSMD